MPKAAPLLLLACLLLPALAHADELTPQKAADIRKLFIVSKFDASCQDVIGLSLMQARMLAEQKGAKLTPEVQEVLDSELNALYQEMVFGTGGFLDQLVPVYAEMFTHEEIREYLKFYETPLGKKIAETTPQATSKASTILLGLTLKMSGELPERIAGALQRKGLLPAQQNSPNDI